LENLHDDVDINRALETIRENIKISAKRVQVIEETVSHGLTKDVKN
jgi:hypothetical protein